MNFITIYTTFFDQMICQTLCEVVGISSFHDVDYVMLSMCNTVLNKIHLQSNKNGNC